MDDKSAPLHRVMGNSMKLAVLLIAVLSAMAQSGFIPPRLADGHPDFGGIWMAASLSAAFNVEAHAASYGTPAGPSVIIDPADGKLPYLPGCASAPSTMINIVNATPSGNATCTPCLA